MSLNVERFYPFVVAVIGGAVAWKLSVPFPTSHNEFLAAALSLGAVLTGFVATAQAILMALPSESVMGRLRTSGYIDDLVNYIAEALYTGIAFCTINLVWFYLNPEHEKFVYYSPVWIAFALYSASTFIRVTRLMMRIMRSP